MKKSVIAIGVAAAMFLSLPAFAGGASSCHFHGSTPAKAEVVSECAVQRQQVLVNSGKIDKSWSAIKPSAPDQVDGEKGKEWRVVFKNPAVTDKTKDTLYMFFTPQGNLIAANFTGK